MFEFDKNYLKFIGPCPVCKSEFISQNIKALKNRRITSLLHVDCDNCESSLFITLIKSGVGVITNVSVLTDLYKDDFFRFKNMPLITVDDVLNLNDNYDKNDKLRTKK